MTGSDLETRLTDTLPDVISTLRLATCDIRDGDVRFDVRSAPHKAPTALPAGRMAIYSFFLGTRCLKVGVVGPKSSARYTSQHYNANSSNSNLAKSLSAASASLELNLTPEQSVGAWMKANLCRADILLPAELGMRPLRLAEAFLHVRWNPMFEGRD